MKTCTKCGVAKPATAEFFYKNASKPECLGHYCKECERVYQRAYKSKEYAKDPEKFRARKRKERADNLEKFLVRERAKGRSKYAERSTELRKEYEREWIKAQRKKCPVFWLKATLRTRLANGFSRGGYSKRSRTHEILGCDFATLAAHLESQFQPGMSWENRGEWHIDHRVPLATAKTEEDVIRLNHYTNLQPLWAADNLAKGARLDWAPPTTGE